MSSLAIELVAASLERVSADVTVVGIFSDERPLRGGASRVDWRLCGGLSELVVEGHVLGKAGERVLLPSVSRVSSPRVLLLGLGPRDRFDETASRVAHRRASQACIELGARRVALVPLGARGEPTPDLLEPVLHGHVEVLAGRDARIELRLPWQREEAFAAVRALEAARRTADCRGVDVELPAAGAWARHSTTARRPRADATTGDSPLAPRGDTAAGLSGASGRSPRAGS